ncbi:MAG: ComEA family DNA-binding protein [Candidatus Geothermincolia bacterium]
MAITERGWGWDIRHSLWVLWTFTLITGFIGFLYIGRRAKKKKWIIWGAIYASVPVIGFIGALLTPEKGYNLQSDIVLGASILMGLYCVGHAFFVLPEYLRAINFLETGYIPEEKTDSPPTTSFPLPTESPAAADTAAPEESPASAGADFNRPGRAVQVALIEINTASLESLASLPGMSTSLAGKAVELREALGPFKTVEEFCEALALGAEASSGLKPLVICHDSGPPPGNQPGRKVDY